MRNFQTDRQLYWQKQGEFKEKLFLNQDGSIRQLFSGPFQRKQQQQQQPGGRRRGRLQEADPRRAKPERSQRRSGRGPSADRRQ